MKFKKVNIKNLKKVLVGTVAAIGICTMSFIGITNSVKAVVVNKTEIISTKYSATDSTLKDSNVPNGYVKAEYQVVLSKYSAKTTSKDMSAQAAAELGVQDLWRLFGVDMNGKTVEMCYTAASSTQPRALWEGIITIDKNLNYWFTVDAITGEHQTTGQNKYWSSDINVGFDKSIEKNPDKYLTLAKEVTEKYKLVSGKVVSTEYIGQGYISNNDGSAKNPQIDIMVTSDNGQRAQLTFSSYNQEFLQVSYDSCVKDMKAFEEQCRIEALEQSKNGDVIDFVISDEDNEKITLKTITK